MNKLLLVASLFLSGCFDLAYSPVWGVEEVVAGARGHIRKEKLPDGVNKEEFKANIQRLITQIEWIDNYNKTAEEKIYLDLLGSNLDSWGCIYFSSYVELPFMGIVPYPSFKLYPLPDCKEPVDVRERGMIYDQESKTYNEEKYPNLRKYYAVCSGSTFIYVLDELKKQHKTFPNIPIRGMTAGEGSSYLAVGALTEGRASTRYLRSIFTSPDFSDETSYPLKQLRTVGADKTAYDLANPELSEEK